MLSNTQTQTAPIEILLVDDDDDDVRLTTKALEDDRVMNRVHRVDDGIEALEFLQREGDFANAPRPDLILLDLNMPRKNGRELLKELKEDPDFRDIPIIILTTSDDQRQITLSYQNYANSYISKPVDLDGFRQALRGLKDYWFSIVKLPSSVR